jgi:hypothetical protein
VYAYVRARVCMLTTAAATKRMMYVQCSQSIC